MFASATPNKRIQKIMFQGARQRYIARGNELIYREIEKLATGTDIVLTDSKRDTGKITRVEGNSTQVVTTQGKNLLDTMKFVKGRIDNGIVGFASGTTNLTTAVSSITMTTDTSYRGCISDFLPVNVSTTYTISPLNLTVTVDQYDVNKTWISRNSNKPFTTTSATKYVRIGFQNPVSGTTTISNPQLEQGSTATAYTPFVPNSPSPDYISPVVSSADNGLTIRSSSATGTSDKVVTLPAGFVGGKLPNGTMDTLEPISNVMNAVKRIGKVVLNGSENWQIREINTNTVRFLISNLSTFATGLNKTLPQCLTDKFITVTGATAIITTNDYELLGNATSQGYINIRINKSRLSTVDVAGFKTWLASNPVTVYYELANPVYTPISDIKIDTYPNNTITSLSSVKPNMTVKYYEK